MRMQPCLDFVSGGVWISSVPVCSHGGLKCGVPGRMEVPQDPAFGRKTSV